MYGRMISMMQKARTDSQNPVIKIEFAKLFMNKSKWVSKCKSNVSVNNKP